MPKTIYGKPTPDRWLTPARVAQLFGVNVRTVARWTRSGKLPAVGDPYHRRYRWSDVQAALAARD